MKTNLLTIAKKLVPAFAGIMLTVGLLLASCTKDNSVNPAQLSSQTQSASVVRDYPHPPIPPINGEALMFLSHGSGIAGYPVYTVTLLPDGHVIYWGIANVKALGIKTFSVSDYAVMRIVDILQTGGFKDLETFYYYEKDLPFYITALKVDGSPLKVEADCGYGVPHWLPVARVQIERILGIDKILRGEPGPYGPPDDHILY